MNADRTYLGIDAGGTGTIAVLMSDDGTVRGVGHGGAANHVSAGIESARESVCEAVQSTLQGRGIIPATIAFGSAGLEFTGDEAVARSLLPSNLSTVPIAFESDALMALEGALAGKSGIVIVAGTGAIGFGRDRDGNQVYAGGWGWRFGDEGSAYWISLRALAAMTKAADGRGPATRLLPLLLAELRLANINALVDWVYAPGRMPDDFAGLAKVVDNAAGDGDEVALTILNEAARELADAAKAVYKKQQRTHTSPVEVSWAGGVFQSRFVREGVRDFLMQEGWGTFCDPQLAPPFGAALHAWRLGQSVGRTGPVDQTDVWNIAVPGQLIATLQNQADNLVHRSV